MRIGKSKKGVSILIITIGSTVALCDFSIAQSAGTPPRGGLLRSSEENKSINTPCYDVMMLDAENENTYLPGRQEGGVPSILAASFMEVGAPAGGYPSITDIVTFNGKMYLSTSSNPLNSWGTNIFHTTDGINFTKVLEDPASQGYLRIGVFDSKLWIPDGDPNGLDPSFVYTSSTGAPGSFAQGSVIQSVHTFDVIKYNNQIYCSNGMASGQGGLCKFDGSSTWNSVYQSVSSVRMKYMAVLNTKLIVANRNSGSDVDCFVFSGDPQTTAPQQMNPVSGATNTFRLFASTQGKVFWSLGASSAQTLVTTDGVTWQTATSLNGKIVSDFAEFNSNLYALASDGLYESTDYFTFTKIASVPASDPNAFIPAASGPGINPDAVASIEVYNGSLWCGSSRNGKIYKVDFATSTPEVPVVSTHYEVTDHSVIFQIENNSPVEVRVYTVFGSLMKNMSYGTVSAGRHEIDLSELKEGFYLLEAIIGVEVKGIKFVMYR